MRDDNLGVQTMRLGRRGARALLVAVLVAAGVGLAVAIEHAGQDVYYVPAYGVAIAIAAFAAAVVGFVLVWRSSQATLGLAAMLTAALAVTGAIAILSIGVLLLLTAFALSVLVASHARRRRDPGGALAGGAVLGVGLPLLAVIALSPPLVDCESGRAGENLFLGLESSSGSGSGSISADGQSSGRVSGDGYEYEYVCRGETLLRFEMRAV
jgi:hypothetical protein